MGSIGRTALEDTRCYLPTSGHEQASKSRWQQIAIGISDGREYSETHTGKSLVDRDAILRSWAVLVRCYTGTELVSFAELYDSYIVEANNERVGSDAGGVGDAIRVLQYQLSDSLELQHISEDDLHIHGEATAEQRLVNTAIHITRDFCTCSDANCRQTLPKPSVKLTDLDQVGGLFSILVASDSKKSSSLKLFVFLFVDFCGLLRN